MITMADVEKLRRIRAREPQVLSLYLPVRLDPAMLRTLPALAGDLIDGAATSTGGAGAIAARDREAVRDILAARGRDWLGHTAAIFACGELDLLEAIPLPCELGGQAVLGYAPYVRPLLAAVQRCPAYLIAVVDRRRAWLLSVAGGQAETIVHTQEPPERSHGFGGWHGRDAYRVQHRIMQRASHHYREVAEILERQAGTGEFRPVVIGGHQDSVSHLLRILPTHARAAFAGSFTADPHTLTPARARALADPVIARWGARREQELASGVLDAAARGHGAVGLAACLTAVSDGAVSQLQLPDGVLAPGFACDRCGALTITRDGCPDWGTAARPVPDLLEEMAGRVLDDNGQVIAIRDASRAVAARLRYPAARDGSENR